jgi:hypothetical protein
MLMLIHQVQEESTGSSFYLIYIPYIIMNRQASPDGFLLLLYDSQSYYKIIINNGKYKCQSQKRR